MRSWPGKAPPDGGFTMTEMLNAHIPAPFAWTGGELGEKGDFVREANAGVLAALDALALRLRGRP